LKLVAVVALVAALPGFLLVGGKPALACSVFTVFLAVYVLSSRRPPS